MFKALQIGQVSRVIPVIGTLTPLFLLAYASLSESISYNQIWAVIFFILGIIVITLPNWKGSVTIKETLILITSSILFTISYIVLRHAYQVDEFMTVFIWSRIILIPLAAIILAIPKIRKKVLGSKNGPKINLLSKIGLLFLIGQAAGGSSELLITYSIHLANPALVNSLQGTQYVFLFISSIVLSKKIPISI